MSYITDQENFLDFSNKARIIWEDNYDTADFKKFCEVIERKQGFVLPDRLALSFGMLDQP